MRLDQRAQFFASCAAASGELLAHTSSANTARDLELLRQAVGDEGLSFLGYSYGTYVGAVYANLFRDRTRAMVFDGALDLVANSTGQPGQEDMPVDVRADTARAKAEELDAFFDRCTQAGPRCAFSSGDPHRKFADMVARLKKGGGGTSFDAVLSIVSRGLQSSTRWSAMATSLQRIYNFLRPEGAGAQDQPATLDPYVPRHSGAFLATQCVAATTHALARRRPRPLPGPMEPSPATPDPGGEQSPRSRDATVECASHQGRAHGRPLLIIDGYGHTTLNVHSACASAAEASYLVTLQLPGEGATCPADYQPFR